MPMRNTNNLYLVSKLGKVGPRWAMAHLTEPHSLNSAWYVLLYHWLLLMLFYSSFLDKNKPFQRMTYSEAIQVLQSSKQNFCFAPKVRLTISDSNCVTSVYFQWGSDLRSEHEQYLLSHCGQRPLFVTDFPAPVRPFYAKRNRKDDLHQTVSSIMMALEELSTIVWSILIESQLIY